MKEQIRRILELMQQGKLPQEDALALLAALNPKLNLDDHELAFVTSALGQPGANPERIADTLMAMKGLDGAARGPQTPPRPPETPQASNWHFEDLGQRISSAVEGAMSATFGNRNAGRPGTILKVEVEEASGSSFNANLPLSLAEHAPKLLPPRALKALEHAGLSSESLVLLLKANPPLGPLLESEDESGNEVRLTIK